MTVVDVVAYELERTAEFIADMADHYPNCVEAIAEISLFVRRRAESLRKQEPC